jgi:hypothetical protein
VRGDTWQWISEVREWHPVDVPGPSPRTFPAFAFDDERREGILFGGNRVLFGTGDETDTFLDDTWRFRNGRWAPLAVKGPSPRAEAAVAYDSRRHRIVLFGGYRREEGRNVRLGDTWEWDGTGWTNVASNGPSPRNGSAMAFDEHRGRVVLFGGPGPSTETWEWDGRGWTPLSTGVVPGRFNPVMAFDAARSLVLRFGGWTGTARSDDTWTLEGGRWRALDAPGPSPRNHASAAYDRRRKRIVLFGGHDGDNVFGDTWEWDGVSWRLMSTQDPQRRVDNRH